MKRVLVLFCAVLALGVVTVGCGDDDNSDSDGGAAATTEETAGDTTAMEDETATDDAGGGDAGGGSASVDVVDIDYDPREITVEAGTTVTWTNTGDLPHTVTLEDGPGEDFDSGTLQNGETYEQTLDQPGTYEYICTIHANQRGTVVVE